MTQDKKTEGGYTFKLKLKGKSKQGGITALSKVQGVFDDNAKNIALNLARLESANAFPKGCYLIITTQDVTAVTPDGVKTEIITFPDYRDRTYDIDINA